MHERQASSKGSLLRDRSMMVDCDQRYSEYSESVSVHAEQVGPALALPLNAILHPPTATVHTDTTSSSTQDGRKEERRDPGRKRAQKGGMKLASSFRRRGVWRQRRRGGDNWTGGRLRGGERWGRKRPLCYPELSVSVCMSVLTQSKSICHQDCHCGTKREGSLPGRTHSERNGERQDRHKEARWSLGEVQEGGGSGNLPRPACSYNSKHTCHIQEDWTSNSLINTLTHTFAGWKYFTHQADWFSNICLVHSLSSS